MCVRLARWWFALSTRRKEQYLFVKAVQVNGLHQNSFQTIFIADSNREKDDCSLRFGGLKRCTRMIGGKRLAAWSVYSMKVDASSTNDTHTRNNEFNIYIHSSDSKIFEWETVHLCVYTRAAHIIIPIWNEWVSVKGILKPPKVLWRRRRKQNYSAIDMQIWTMWRETVWMWMEGERSRTDYLYGRMVIAVRCSMMPFTSLPYALLAIRHHFFFLRCCRKSI